MRYLQGFNVWSFLSEYLHQLSQHYPYIHDCVPKSNIFCEMIVYGFFKVSSFFQEGWCIFADLVSGKHTMVIS